MSHKTGYIHDKELDEYYVREQDQCEFCQNEAESDGLCRDCEEERDKLSD